MAKINELFHCSRYDFLTDYEGDENVGFEEDPAEEASNREIDTRMEQVKSEGVQLTSNFLGSTVPTLAGAKWLLYQVIQNTPIHKLTDAEGQELEALEVDEDIIKMKAMADDSNESWLG